jgi:hypothetical protein
MVRFLSSLWFFILYKQKSLPLVACSDFTNSLGRTDLSPAFTFPRRVWCVWTWRTQ